MSEPVGRPPLVALTERVRSGAVPVQPKQNRFMSARSNVPVIPAVKVCPHHVVVFNVLPEPESDVLT